MDQVRYPRSAGSDSDALLTVEQTAQRLGTSPRFVRRLVAQRRIAVTRVGRHVRIASPDLAAFLAAGRVEASRGSG